MAKGMHTHMAAPELHKKEVRIFPLFKHGNDNKGVGVGGAAPLSISSTSIGAYRKGQRNSHSRFASYHLPKMI